MHGADMVRVLACVVTICCNCLVGIIALIIAGKHSSKRFSSSNQIKYDFNNG